MEPKLRLAQTYLQRTDQGYFKNSQMIITNHELYLFNDRNKEDYDKLIVLTPGVFVKSLSAINFD